MAIEIKPQHIESAIIGMWRQGASATEIFNHLNISFVVIHKIIDNYKFQLKKKEVLCENGKNNS